MSLLKRAGALALAITMLVTIPGVATPTNKQRARMAVHWLSNEQAQDGSFPGFSPIGSTADAVVSFAAAKRSPEDIAEAVAYLEANEAQVDSIGEKAKVVMALAATPDGDPRDFAGRDLVQEILDSQQPDGRFGATTEVFNHALAMIALAAAGEEPSGPERDWLLAAQCSDGGWEYQDPSGPTSDTHCFDGDLDYFVSDTDTTAYAVIALAGLKRWGANARRDPFRFFKTRRDPIKKGWGYSYEPCCALTNSNSTALVIEAHRSHGHYKNVPRGAVRALTRLQYPLCGENAGAFAYSYREKEGGGYRKMKPDLGATIGAILGLVRHPYDAVDVTKPPPEPDPC